MSVTMAMDREAVTVQTMHPVQGRGPVLYANLTQVAPAKGQGSNGEDAKHRLVTALWDHLAARENPFWKHCRTDNGTAFPIQVECGLLGRPHLLVGEFSGPAISFSTGGGKVWAALCGDESAIGIDVAGADEFHGEYPFQRVFHPRELQHALRLTGGDVEEASALLWSVKEAVVKALGCAFHLVEPRQVNVYPCAGEGNGFTFPVGLSGKARERFPLTVGRSLWVHSLAQRNMWLSIAHFDRRQTDHA
jgi:phosphopantetheinyl transferase (holo-ACP synthase)